MLRYLCKNFQKAALLSYGVPPNYQWQRESTSSISNKKLVLETIRQTSGRQYISLMHT